MICIFAGTMIISCINYPGTVEVLSGTAEADDLNSSLVNNEDSNEADSNELDDTDFSDEVIDGEILEFDNNMDNLSEEQEEEENIIGGEETGEGQGQEDGEEIKDENNNPGQDEDQNIDFSNSDDFRIEVDLSRQRVFIYYKDNRIKEMICSGGTEEKPTPIGEFETYEKIEYSWVTKYNMGAYYWTRFYNEYLFHSVPFDENGEMIIEEYEKLRSPASHGCIRLKLEEAKWLYEMLPLGVEVLIYE